MIISRTPLRVSFLGGGTDYPAYFQRHGGCTLATSIDKYVYVTVSPLTPFFNHRIGLHYSRVERVGEVDELQHPSVKACLQYLGIDGGVEIHIASDLPARTGLGSSSAFTVGLLHALRAFRGEDPSCQDLAAEAVHVEQDLIGERVGSQDQYACALGGPYLLRFLTSGAVEASPVPGMDDAFTSHLMLFYTGIQRYAHEILDEQLRLTRERRRDSVLAELARLAESGNQLLASGGPVTEFGVLLHQGWELKKQCSSQVSSPQIDAWYDQARAAGAIGGKLLGAGGGGFLLLFAPPESHNAIREAVPTLRQVPFALDHTGSQIIFAQ